MKTSTIFLIIGGILLLPKLAKALTPTQNPITSPTSPNYLSLYNPSAGNVYSPSTYELTLQDIQNAQTQLESVEPNFILFSDAFLNKWYDARLY